MNDLLKQKTRSMAKDYGKSEDINTRESSKIFLMKGKQIEKWLKKFDERFVENTGKLRFLQSIYHVDEVRNFLASAIQESVVESLESLRMEEMNFSKLDKENIHATGIVVGYNTAVSELNSKIDKLTK